MEGDEECCPRDHARAATLLKTLERSLLPRKKKNPLAAASRALNEAAVRNLDLLSNCLTCKPLIEQRGKMLPTVTDCDAPTDVQIAPDSPLDQLTPGLMQELTDLHALFTIRIQYELNFVSTRQSFL
jgi:hypothetical protein